MTLSEINTILRSFSIRAESFNDISDKGYSGAKIFRIATKTEVYILKGFPTDIDIERVIFVHEVMDEARNNGFSKLPRVLNTNDGNHILNALGHVWEVVSVMRGTPLKGIPTLKQCEELGKAVAKLHNSLRNFPEEKILRRRGVVTYESLVNHYIELKGLVKTNEQLFAKADLLLIIQNFLNISENVLRTYFDSSNFDTPQRSIPRLVIHQDLWKDNIFFEGNTFTGFIDFSNAKHCARLDEIAKVVIEVTDLSPKETEAFLSAYASIWPFTGEEKKLFLQWVLNWVIFSPFWHVEKCIENTQENIQNNNRITEMITRSQHILERLERRELEYLKEIP